MTDTVLLVNEAITSGKNVLVEGANAAMLDLDFGIIIIHAITVI